MNVFILQNLAKAKKAIAPPPATQRQLEVERKRKLEEQLARRNKMEVALRARGEEQVELELEDIEWLVSADMCRPIPLRSTHQTLLTVWLTLTVSSSSREQTENRA